MGGCLVICVILAFVLELRTRKRYKDRGERAENESWFDSANDEDDDEEDGEPTRA